VGELGGELWGFIGLIVDVIRREVELHSRESSDSFNLGEISRDQFVSSIPAKRVVTLAVALEAPEK
jgi:hypothetical protein